MSDNKHSKLRWQCRRGVKELDVVLSEYLDNHYSQANAKEQQDFEDLLRLEDPLLLSCLMNEDDLDDKDQQILVEKLRSLF